MWIDDVNAELVRARTKFPGTDFVVTAFSEEAGELVKAVLDHMYGKASYEEVYWEAIQSIAMAVRVIEEGDPIHKLPALNQKSEYPNWESLPTDLKCLQGIDNERI